MRVTGFALVFVMTSIVSSAPAQATEAKKELTNTPFDSPPNVALLRRLAAGDVVTRSLSDGTLNADDRARVRSLGLDRLDVATVVLRYIPRTHATRQLDRIRTLAHAVDGFTPAGICDRIAVEGDGKGLCTGTVDGPIGRALVRLPFAIEHREQDGGEAHFSLANMRPLEAKALLSWTRLVAPNRLRLAVDLYPVDSGWYVYTRIGVEMSAHASAAKTLAEQMLKLDTWLSHELGHK